MAIQRVRHVSGTVGCVSCEEWCVWTCCWASCSWLWSCCVFCCSRSIRAFPWRHISLSSCKWACCFLTFSLSLLTSASCSPSYTHTHSTAMHKSSTSSVFIAWLNIENYSAASKHTLMHFSWIGKQAGGDELREGQGRFTNSSSSSSSEHLQRPVQLFYKQLKSV